MEHLVDEIEAAGAPAFREFPFVNKIVELCAIGHYQEGV